MLGRNGVVNQLLTALGLQSTPTNLLYNFGAVLVGMVHALMPLAVLTMLSVMDNIDRNLPRAALTLGARPGHRLLAHLLSALDAGRRGRRQSWSSSPRSASSSCRRCSAAARKS